MTRSAAGLQLLLSLGWVAGSLTYPSIWASASISFLQSLSPGDKFGHMRIQSFENQTEQACVITSDIPNDRFLPSLDYNITVSSSVEGGVGHLVVASAGHFHTLRHDLQAAAFTDHSERQSNVTWLWRSPAAADTVHAVVVGLYAVCATGYGGRAYVATPQDFIREGTPATTCSIGETNPATVTCLCSSRSPGAIVCPAGFCCRSDGVCLECKSRSVLDWSLWLHSLFALFASGFILSFSSTGGLARKMQRADAIQKKMACLFQVLGLVCAVFYVQMRYGWRQHFEVGRVAHNLLGIAGVASSVPAMMACFQSPPNASSPSKSCCFVWCISAAIAMVAVCTGISAAASLHDYGHLVVASIVGACVSLGAALIWQLIMWRCSAMSRRNIEVNLCNASSSNDQAIAAT